jgi:hypothetical protein
MDRIVLKKDILEKMYLRDMLSIRAIAKELNVNDMTVRKHMKEYDIPMRNKSWKSEFTKNGEEVQCETCGKMIYRKKYLLNKYSVFFCSRKCEKEYQSKTRCISELPEAWRRRRGYKAWRKKVLERDNNECKLCGSNIKLNVHHIIEVRDNPSLRYDVNNGITLCQKCHIEVHKNDSKNYIKPLQEAIFVENPEYR